MKKILFFLMFLAIAGPASAKAKTWVRSEKQFKKFDKNKDGVLNLKEFKKAANGHLKKSLWDSEFVAIDADASGDLSFDEFYYGAPTPGSGSYGCYAELVSIDTIQTIPLTFDVVISGGINGVTVSIDEYNRLRNAFITINPESTALPNDEFYELFRAFVLNSISQ